ncbi:MAG: Twin-arginine translocation pathway signal [Desulfobulbus propionicus]|nr:MAG: Twin-arginine translocation pathway signal [Desulfobulbus propionicus]
MTPFRPTGPTASRRHFLKRSAQLFVALAVCSPIRLSASPHTRRFLSFYHTHTGKRLNISYAYGKRYDALALEQIKHYLRDFRTGEEHGIDPRLLDILWNIQQDIGREGIFEVISGYRSPATNRKLRQQSSGVARHSLHMQGRAIDVRFTGAPTKYLQQSAITMKCGGVGYYRHSDFVHLDTGHFRTW